MNDVMTARPGRWTYSWLGNPGGVIEPLARADVVDALGRVDPAKWAVAWAERVARGLPPLAKSVLHTHVPACYAGAEELISLKLSGQDHVGIVDQVTGHWITTRIATAAESRDSRDARREGVVPGPNALPVFA